MLKDKQCLYDKWKKTKTVKEGDEQQLQPWWREGEWGRSRRRPWTAWWYHVEWDQSEWEWSCHASRCASCCHERWRRLPVGCEEEFRRQFPAPQHLTKRNIANDCSRHSWQQHSRTVHPNTQLTKSTNLFVSQTGTPVPSRSSQSGRERDGTELRWPKKLYETVRGLLMLLILVGTLLCGLLCWQSRIQLLSMFNCDVCTIYGVRWSCFVVGCGARRD